MRHDGAPGRAVGNAVLLVKIYMLGTFVPFAPSFAPSFAAPDNSSCAAFSTKPDSNCATTDCKLCFNEGAREGVMCNGAGGQTGYYCPADAGKTAEGDASEGDLAFACMDWTFGSKSMKKAESAFNLLHSEDVFFGVGTFGTSSDPQNGLGACYRLRAKGVKKDIIAQSLNTGHDVAGNQFDLQIGAGGAGAYNTCAGSSRSMYDGSVSVWGCQYGGIDTKEACSGLPKYPRDATAMRKSRDDLVSLCEYGWDQHVRLSGADQPAGPCKYNPTLIDVARVKCPDQLVSLTWLQRADEPEGFSATPSTRLDTFASGANHTCRSEVSGAGTAYCLTRMMDCRKPSGGFKDNIRSELMVPGKRVVQTCTSDGYTRQNVACGCADCYC